MTQTENTGLAKDYIRGVANRVEQRTLDYEADTAKIMALLGYETMAHGRLGMACRKIGDNYWQSVPRFNSADDFELWVCREGGSDMRLNDISRDASGQWAVSYEEQLSNDYGFSQSLGAAMWAAFIRVRAGTLYGWPEEE